MLNASMKLRILRERLVLDVDGQPPVIVGRVIRERGGAYVLSATGEATPLELHEIEGGLK